MRAWRTSGPTLCRRLTASKAAAAPPLPQAEAFRLPACQPAACSARLLHAWLDHVAPHSPTHPSIHPYAHHQYHQHPPTLLSLHLATQHLTSMFALYPLPCCLLPTLFEVVLCSCFSFCSNTLPSQLYTRTLAHHGAFMGLQRQQVLAGIERGGGLGRAEPAEGCNRGASEDTRQQQGGAAEGSSSLGPIIIPCPNGFPVLQLDKPLHLHEKGGVGQGEGRQGKGVGRQSTHFRREHGS